MREQEGKPAKTPATYSRQQQQCPNAATPRQNKEPKPDKQHSPSRNAACTLSTMEQNALNVTKVTKNRVYGTVNTETGGTLFLSIINNPGWKVYIDGKETPTYCVDTAFTGCDISAGEHSVELVYKPIFFMQALVISGAGLLALIAVLVLRRTVFRNNRECSTAR